MKVIKIVEALETPALPADVPVEVYQFAGAGVFALLLMVFWRMLNGTGKTVLAALAVVFILWAVFG